MPSGEKSVESRKELRGTGLRQHLTGCVTAQRAMRGDGSPGGGVGGPVPRGCVMGRGAPGNGRDFRPIRAALRGINPASRVCCKVSSGNVTFSETELPLLRPLGN